MRLPNMFPWRKSVMQERQAFQQFDWNGFLNYYREYQNLSQAGGVARYLNPDNQIRVTPRLAMRIPAYRLGVNLIANTIATLPVSVQRGMDLLENHPTANVLAKRANPSQTSVDFWRIFMYMEIVRGAGYMMFNRNRINEISQAYVLHTDRCVLTPDGLLYKPVRGREQLFENGEFAAMVGLPNIDSTDLLNPADPMEENAYALLVALYAYAQAMG